MIVSTIKGLMGASDFAVFITEKEAKEWIEGKQQLQSAWWQDAETKIYSTEEEFIMENPDVDENRMLWAKRDYYSKNPPIHQMGFTKGEIQIIQRIVWQEIRRDAGNVLHELQNVYDKCASTLPTIEF